jgi:hypothetical protein
VALFQENNPDAQVIRLGIGDVTRPCRRRLSQHFIKGVDEMASDATFRGYGPEQGYAFLREKIAAHDYQARGADISADEIFVSDGAKCDTGNFQELFAKDIRIAIPDPVYPVYLDTNVMAGRTGEFEDGRYKRSSIWTVSGKTIFCRSCQRTGGSDLPVLSQQPHRHLCHKIRTGSLGGLCQDRTRP